jgi:hypothetical protein
MVTDRLKQQIAACKKTSKEFKPQSVAPTLQSTAQRLSNQPTQIYHEDKGYDDRQIIFLSPAAPSFAVRRVLLTHPHSAQMMYLQGSPFRPLVSLPGRLQGSPLVRQTQP